MMYMDSIHKKDNIAIIRRKHGSTMRFDVVRSSLERYHNNPFRAERFARGGFRSHFFYTEDSGRYRTPLQRARIAQTREKIFNRHSSFDTINARYVSLSSAGIMDWSQLRLLSMRPLRAVLASWRGWWHFDISPLRAWNLSLVGAMLFGMISMTMIYRSFGVSAFATEPSAQPVHEGNLQEMTVEAAPAVAAQREIVAKGAQYVATTSAKRQTVAATIVRDPAQEAFEARARAMVKGYPIEKMLPEIFKQDRVVAAFLIAMAKQESQWGKRVPVLNGQDCLNYWGFRSKRARMGTGGHTCFDSIADAVQTVGHRVEELVYKYNRTTANRMIIWKCGYSCDGHDPYNVASWKRTVQMYYDKLMKG